jgi:hypothetical protein
VRRIAVGDPVPPGFVEYPIAPSAATTSAGTPGARGRRRLSEGRHDSDPRECERDRHRRHEHASLKEDHRVISTVIP